MKNIAHSLDDILPFLLRVWVAFLLCFKRHTYSLNFFIIYFICIHLLVLLKLLPLGFYYLEILDYHVGIQMNTNLHLTHLLLANHVCLIIKLKIVWLLTYWYSMENWKNKIYYLSSKKITRRSYTCPSGRLTCRARSFLSFRWEMQIMSAKKKKKKEGGWGSGFVLKYHLQK